MNSNRARYKHETVNNAMLRVQKEERKDIKPDFEAVSSLQVKLKIFFI